MSKVQITVTVFEDAESWLREHLPDMSTDSVACVKPITKLNLDGTTTYKDFEEGKEKHNCTLQDHIEALQLLCEKVGDSLFVGGVKSPKDLVDPGNWDVEVVDAYYQLVMYKEVLYG